MTPGVSAQPPRNGGIFISYRNGDEEHATLWIDQVLSERFGSDWVFRDSRSLDAGTDFQADLWTTLARCSTMVVVIGHGWLRDDWTGDFVRQEIKQALNLSIKVIPVLIGNASLPTAASLPEDIRPLAGKQYIRLRSARDGDDIERLVKAVKPSPKRVGLVLASSLVISTASMAVEIATDLKFDLNVWIIVAAFTAISALLNLAVAAGWPAWLLGRRARLTRWLRGWHRWPRLAFGLSIVLLVAATAAVVTAPPAGCLGSTRTYGFEGSSADGWDIRYENDARVGTSLDQGDYAHAGSFGLDFAFSLSKEPMDKGQIKVDKLPLRSALSAFILVPRSTALTIQVTAFVLERVDVAQDQSHWSFHWANHRTVQPGQWTLVTFHPADFKNVRTDPPMSFRSTEWENPPLLIGFEFRSTERNNTPVVSHVYLDDISVC